MDTQKKTIWRSAIGGLVISLVLVIAGDWLGIDDGMSLPSRLLCSVGVGIAMGVLWVGIEKLFRRDPVSN